MQSKSMHVLAKSVSQNVKKNENYKGAEVLIKLFLKYTYLGVF